MGKRQKQRIAELERLMRLTIEWVGGIDKAQNAAQQDQNAVRQDIAPLASDVRALRTWADTVEKRFHKQDEKIEFVADVAGAGRCPCCGQERADD